VGLKKSTSQTANRQLNTLIIFHPNLLFLRAILVVLSLIMKYFKVGKRNALLLFKPTQITVDFRG
jgi:hypothetical protein